MMQAQENTLRVQGPLSMQTAGGLLQEFSARLVPGDCILDLSDVTELDSSALAVIQALMRRAEISGAVLRIRAAPEALRSLAALYDVEEFLPLEQIYDDVSDAVERR